MSIVQHDTEESLPSSELEVVLRYAKLFVEFGSSICLEEESKISGQWERSIKHHRERIFVTLAHKRCHTPLRVSQQVCTLAAGNGDKPSKETLCVLFTPFIRSGGINAVNNVFVEKSRVDGLRLRNVVWVGEGINEVKGVLKDPSGVPETFSR